MSGKQKLLLLQVYIHLSFIIGLFFIPFYLVIPALILSQIVYVGFCGTTFFHRIVTHKNQVNPVWEKILLLLSWIGCSGPAIAWAGTHRKHHRYSDTKNDPHSPIYMGKLKAYWYSSGDKEILRYVPDLLRKPWYMFQFKYYFQALLLLHILSFMLLPYQYYWIFFIVPGFLMWFSGSLINVFCHDKNGPKNVPILGYLIAGEGWHKNHHEQSANPNFRNFGDWGYYIYNLIK